MVFSSLEFIFIFLTIFIVVYSAIPVRFRNGIIFAASLIFYSYGLLDTPLYILLFVLTVVLNYIVGQFIGESVRHKKWWLAFGILFDFGWLVFFKYSNFLLENINACLGLHLPLSEIVLPIGISFYTFQNVSYLVDVYRGKVRPERSFIRYGAYITLFPQLIAGPIVTYDRVARQLRYREHRLANIDEGLRYFTIGLGLKVLIANQIGNLWTDIQGIGYESISTPLAWMGMFAYTFQIYFDFYGYSMMAVGLGKMMGFDLPRNFDHPYTAISMSDFWRKWHITLGSWFREYVYIPLGGNRVGKLKLVRNLFIVWVFTGLWHGASWNFVLWGFLLFVILTVEKFLIGKFLHRHRIIGHMYMIAIIPVSWLVFAITDMRQLSVYIKKLFPFLGQAGQTLFAEDYVKYWEIYGLFFLIAILFSTKLPAKIYEKFQFSYITLAGLLAIFWLSVYCLYIGMNDPFLYFRF